MGLDEANKVFDKYKDVYKKGVVLKDNNEPQELFEIDKLEITENFSVWCHFHKIENGFLRYEPINSVIKNFEIQS